MVFVPIDQLKEGMMLDRDVYLYDCKTSKVAMLRSGQVLNSAYIQKLNELHVLGAYIYTTKSDIDLEERNSPVRRELKEEAVSSVQQVFTMFHQAANQVSVSCIRQTMEVSKKLVTAMKSNREAKLSIANLKLYDDYTYNHSFGVSILSIAIGLALGLRTSDLYDLGFCALLHDIGKMDVPIEIIAKPARLTREEFQIVKQHPVKGAEFFHRHRLASPRICAGVLTHHEKFDGSGYPKGLKGEQIPLIGRIISVADVYDALTSVRPYRKSSPPAEAIEYIMGGCDNLFDTNVVEAFLKKVSPYPVGSCVRLSNGEIAIVVEQNENHPLRPYIRMINSPDRVLDLYRERELQHITVDGVCNIAAEETPNS
ncbi:MAG: HD-GYP domain-containing protein [Clostridiales bacterium]|nr:HD-GYP domain-containing protein [Clostridiales bacterium]